MILYRITDLDGVFLRDDFTYNPDTEIGLDVDPAQGLYQPKWDGEKWIESATDIPEPTPPEPTETERLAVEIEELRQIIDILLGGEDNE